MPETIVNMTTAAPGDDRDFDMTMKPALTQE